MIIFDRHYSSEELCDIEKDIWHMFDGDTAKIPKDEHGFHKGEFRVTVEWIEEE